jgi:dUTP pyrophosphatase
MMPGPWAGAGAGGGAGVGLAVGVPLGVAVLVGVGGLVAVEPEAQAAAIITPATSRAAAASAVTIVTRFKRRAPSRAGCPAKRIFDAASLAINCGVPLIRPADTLAPVESMELRVRKLRPEARLPRRATPHATGFDLYASLDTPVVLGRAPRLVGTGVAIEVPAGFDAQVRPRSGLSLRGIGVAFGTIDTDYRGELLVTMWIAGDMDRYEVRDGDRIAQLVIARLTPVEVVEVRELTPTSRADGGHGSTGR